VEPGDNTRFTPAPPTRPPRAAARPKQRPPLRLIALLALAVIAGLLTWYITGRGDNNSSSSGNATKTANSEQDLQKLVATLSGPVFWAGPQKDVRYELEQRSNGQIYLRYLSEKMKPGTGTVLTVGTYPMRNAYASTVALGKKKGWTRLATGSGGVAAFVNSARPLSVYFAIQGLNDQVEVYDPAPGHAAALVRSGRVLPIEQGERLGLRLGALKKQVASLGQTVYWLGPMAGVTYEYTLSPGGNVYLRYLPKGVAVGSSGAYPTVGTYPMKDAAAKTKARAGESGAVQVKLAGAESFYTTAKPNNVYLAFKGSSYQIEVFDPVSAQALAAVKSGQVKPVG
jgi:hypothetical protein